MSNENADRPSQSIGKKHAPRGRIKAPVNPIQGDHPMQVAPLTGGQPCKARGRRTKKPCGNPAMLGGTVCRMHGGKAPQVMLKAEERLKAMEGPALGRLEHWMMQDAFPSVSISAVKDALDRIRGKAVEQQILEHKGGITITHEMPE